MTIRRAVILGLFLAFAAQFADAQEATDPQAEAGPERVCLNVRAIRSFDALTDEYVYVREGSDKHYLFTMRHRCHNLRDAQGIVIKDVTSRLCSDGFGEILYRDRFGSRRLESCLIGSIQQVESKDAAKSIVVSLENDDHG